MPATLLLSPTIDLSTQHSLAELGSLKSGDPFTPVSFLLPTGRVIQDFRKQLGSAVNVNFTQFYGLGQDILEAAGSRIHEISDTSVSRLVRVTLQEMLQEGEISSFAAVLDKPGFTNVLIGWLREMKSQGITPEAYLAHARESGKDRDRQLGTFYQRYQDSLQGHDLADPDGVLWLACEALAQDRGLSSNQGALFVIGFDQFSPVQLELLRLLHTRYDRFAIYLGWAGQRPEDSLALTRLARTRNQLLAALSLETRALDGGQSADGTALSFLSQVLFETENCAEPPEVNDDIRLIEAPSREQEVRTALCQIKQLLIEGLPPAGIMLLAPHPASYLDIVRSVAEEYDTPVLHDQFLAHNPAIIALLNLLSIPPDYPWRETLEALRSPYVDQAWLSPGQIDTLDRLSRERPVIGGREQWRYALKPVSRAIDPDLQEVDEEFEGGAKAVEGGADELAEIETGLMAFFDRITPPETGTIREYTWWLQTEILGIWPEPEDGQEAEPPPAAAESLNLLEACQGSEHRERDTRAIAELAGILRQMLRASETIPSHAQTLISRDQYLSELAGLIHRRVLPRDRLTGGVTFGPLEEARARSMEHLFVLGLSEGEFPSPPPADVFYASTEREEHPLPLVRFVPADDATLWWQVVSSCRERLTLLRPYLDENGADWMPSPYWDEIQQRIPDLKKDRIPIAPRPAIEDSASLSELLVALAVNDAQRVPEELQRSWAAARVAQSVIDLRQSDRPHGKYEGFFTAHDLSGEFGTTYGHDHVWSPSRLNSYGNCPYGYFAQVILKLEARVDPQEGMDALQFGSLLHEILEETYKRLTDEGIALSMNTHEEALEILEQVSNQTLAAAPIRYGFRPGALWRYEREDIQRMLTSLIRWECEENGEVPRFTPYLQEVKFGLGRDTLPTLHVREGGTNFRVHGVIDRVDRDADGNLRIIDYKSGRTPFSRTDIKRGLSLQTAIYALAAEQHLSSGTRVIDSFYLHIPTRERSGQLRFSAGVIEDETVQEAVGRAQSAIEHIGKGEFPAAPGKPTGGSSACRSRCEYASLCRVTRQSTLKARRRGF